MRFRQSAALLRVAKLVVAEQLPRSSLKRPEKVFRNADIDDDGLLSADEVREALKGHCLELTDVLNALLEEACAGVRGVDLVEFAAMLLDEQEFLQQQNLLAAFRRLDKDGSGRLS